MNLCFSLNSKTKTKRNTFFSKGQKNPKCSFTKKKNVHIPSQDDSITYNLKISGAKPLQYRTTKVRFQKVFVMKAICVTPRCS